MGWKYEVQGYFATDEGYAYVSVYEGQSLIKAILAMRKAKKVCGCVKLAWRG